MGIGQVGRGGDRVMLARKDVARKNIEGKQSGLGKRNEQRRGKIRKLEESLTSISLVPHFISQSLNPYWCLVFVEDENASFLARSTQALNLTDRLCFCLFVSFTLSVSVVLIKKKVTFFYTYFELAPFPPYSLTTRKSVFQSMSLCPLD